jgi:hypothetical protein
MALELLPDSMRARPAMRLRGSLKYVIGLPCTDVVGVLWAMASKRKPKGKAKNNKKANLKPHQDWSLKTQYGRSGLAEYIDEHGADIEAEGKHLIRLEPAEWLDYACVGVTYDGDNYHAIYDLNILERVIALMFAYSDDDYKGGYDSPTVYSLNTDNHLQDAQEWVDYNTLRACEHLTEGKPLFVRSHWAYDYQVNWTEFS